MGENGTVLDRILAQKRVEVDGLRSGTDPAELRDRALNAPPSRDFLSALNTLDRVPVIAEIKKASPSAGRLAGDVDVALWARRYRNGGAAALSVLTDGPFFGGCLADLDAARSASGLPVLRKDFIIDPLQLYESRAAGADAVLLIVAAIGRAELENLFALTLELNMTPLIEVHQEAEMEAALALDPPLVGINSRDLKTLDVNLETALRLRPLVPPGITVVAESGVKSPADVARLRAGGLDAFLVGTTLMRARNPESELAGLCRIGEA
ncbi:MAG: indole-3-glycerol phosphate synthase TrpC [Proteobacteria bacterium]|nr:indole-3-glycerol phosphate synthase TrpC [Pseudomonadota bacterium]